MNPRTKPIDQASLRLAASFALFDGVPEQALEMVRQRCRIRHLAAGEILLEKDQSNQTLYLLLEGQLSARIDRVDSKQRFPSMPGQCVGEVSIVDGQPTTAYVVADQDSRVLAIDESVLWNEFVAYPRLARNFVHLFASRFRANVESMRRGLEQQFRYEQLQKDLTVARDIQRGMLPRIPKLEGVDLCATMIPAQHIGGDFYDVFPITPNRWCIAIGDVSGKGISAALFVVRAMTQLRTEILKGQPVETAMAELNAVLCIDNPTCMFATLIVGIMDTQSGVFEYVTAGHDALALARRGETYQLLPRPTGILAGISETAQYESASVQLASGDALVLYTDGITEAMNASGALFTGERFIQVLDAHRSATADDLARQITIAVKQFAGEAAQSDDITMVILRRQTGG